MSTKEQTNLDPRKILRRTCNDPSTWKFFYHAERQIPYDELMEEHVHNATDRRAFMDLVTDGLVKVENGIVSLTYPGYKVKENIKEEEPKVEQEQKRRIYKPHTILQERWHDKGRTLPWKPPT